MGAVFGYLLANNILVVPAASPAKSVAELVALGKTKPEGLSYGSQGAGAGGHLAAMMLATDWAAQGVDLPSGLVRRALSISGLYDLEPLRHTPFIQGDLRLQIAGGSAGGSLDAIDTLSSGNC